MDADQGRRIRVRHGPGAGRGRGAVPARFGYPLARRRGRPDQAVRHGKFAKRGAGGTAKGTGGTAERAAQDGSAEMNVLEMRQVSRVYGQGAAEVRALLDVDLAVGAGSMVAVMGPSGSGKSTLLTIAGSLEEPSSGEVRVCGTDLATLPGNGKARLRRRVIGYVFQEFNLLPGLTAAENVSLPLELEGVALRRARSAGMAALESLGMAGRASRSRGQLSGGEWQRVPIALAAAGDRRLL